MVFPSNWCYSQDRNLGGLSDSASKKTYGVLKIATVLLSDFVSLRNLLETRKDLGLIFWLRNTSGSMRGNVRRRLRYVETITQKAFEISAKTIVKHVKLVSQEVMDHIPTGFIVVCKDCCLMEFWAESRS